MLFIAFNISAQINISDVHIHLKKITYKTIFYRNRVFIVLNNIVLYDTLITHDR